MKVKSTLKAMVIGATVAALGLASAASAKGLTAPVLSQKILGAVVGAQADARSQGLNAGRTRNLIDSAVSRVIASSGADGATVTAALDLSKRNLASDPVAVGALDQAAGAVVAYQAPPKGGGSSNLKTAGGAGGSDYRGG